MTHMVICQFSGSLHTGAMWVIVQLTQCFMLKQAKISPFPESFDVISEYFQPPWE